MKILSYFLVLFVVKSVHSQPFQIHSKIDYNTIHHLDSVHLDGYFIYAYVKATFNEKVRNYRRQLMGKTFKFLIDDQPVILFVTKAEVRERGIESVINDIPKRNKFAVYFTSECPDFLELTKEEDARRNNASCGWPTFTDVAKKYTTKKSPRYCFYINEIAGWFRKMRVVSEEEKQQMGKSIAYVNPTVKEFDAYFFSCYTSYSNFPSIRTQLIPCPD